MCKNLDHDGAFPEAHLCACDIYAERCSMSKID